MKIVIATHHRMAIGLKETIDFLSGETQSIMCIAAYAQSSPPIEEQVAQVMASLQAMEDMIVLCDIVAGSVTQQFFPFCSEHVHVIAGINVPLALAIVLQCKEHVDASTILAIIEEAKAEICYVNQMKTALTKDDE